MISNDWCLVDMCQGEASAENWCGVRQPILMLLGHNPQGQPIEDKLYSSWYWLILVDIGCILWYFRIAMDRFILLYHFQKHLRKRTALPLPQAVKASAVDQVLETRLILATSTRRQNFRMAKHLSEAPRSQIQTIAVGITTWSCAAATAVEVVSGQGLRRFWPVGEMTLDPKAHSSGHFA